MLIPFVVDPSTFTACAGLPERRLKSIHGQLIGAWRRQGLLVTDGESAARCRVNRSLNALPSGIRRLWADLLDPRNGATIPGPAFWDGLITPVDEPKLRQLAETARVLFTDDETASSSFGLSPDSDCIKVARFNNLEVCPFNEPSGSEAFRSAGQLARRSISAGDLLETLWVTRVRPFLAVTLKDVTIVDRFCVAQLLTPLQGRPLPAGLENVLRLVARDARSRKNVTIFFEATDGLANRTAGEIGAELRAKLLALDPDSRIGAMTLHQFPQYAMGNPAHGRFIRFGNRAWSIDRGLAVFAGDSVEASSTAALHDTLEDPHFGEVTSALLGDHRRQSSVISGPERKLKLMT